MRRWMMAGAAAMMVGGGVAYMHSALSQPSPPAAVEDGPAAPSAGGPGPRGGMMGGRMGGMMMRQPGGREAMMHRLRNFALVWRAPDRNLSGADVQKIAEGFLLWHGNHTWKVTNVQEQGDSVAFSLATPDGGTIASFKMDRHTGRLERTG